MDFKQLNYFVKVAEELHFGKAAEKLNISQPPLSRQISQLEELIGAKLLIRTKRHVELTSAGKFLLEKSYEILNDTEKAFENTRKIHEGRVGQLNIGHTGVLNTFYIDLVHQFRLKFPQTEVTLTHLSSKDQIRALLEDDIQFGFMCPPLEEKDLLNYRFIRRLPFVVALPTNHYLAERNSPIGLEELKNEPFILSPRSIEPWYYDTIISACQKAGFYPNVVQKAGGIYSITNFIASELGVSIVSKAVSTVPNPGVVFKEIRNPVPYTELHLAWDGAKNLSIMNNFLNLIESKYYLFNI